MASYHLILIVTMIYLCGFVTESSGQGEGCTEGGKKYKDGDNWICSDGCNTCWCSNGRVFSTLMACPSKRKGCTEGDKHYEDGERWTCSDGCNTCWCSNGLVGSTLMACP